MAEIRLGPFGPIVPRTAERQLPEGASQIAANVNVLSGEIRPIREPDLVSSGMATKIAVYRAEYGGTEKWRGWTMDVDVVRVPLAADVEARYVWSGDGPPRWAKYTDFDTPANDKQLGIPTPVTSPTVTPSGGVGPSVDRIYVYTFFSQDGEESGPSPNSTLTTGKTDDTWAITGMDGFPLNTGSVSTALKDTPSAGYIRVTTTAAHWLRAGDQISISGVTGMTDLNGDWTITGIISSTQFYVTKTTTQTYTSGGTWTRKALWNITSMTRRLYRSAGTNASFQLVAENISGTTYNDTLTDDQIEGDDLISATWLPPPTGLRGIVALPNGALVGFVNNLLCFSEPYQAHAWPLDYQFGMSQNAVGLAAFGTTVVVGTAGAPYIGDGVDPSNVTLQDHQNVWPCLAKRSMVSIGDGVVYSSTFGLVYIGTGGANIWSQPYYTREEWTQADPVSVVCAVAEGKVFALHQALNAESTEILVFLPTEPLASLTTLDINCQELYSDPRDGHLYIVDSEGAKQYDSAEGARIPFEWLSKEVELPTPVNFGAARVEFVSEITEGDATALLDAYNAALAAQPAKIANGVGALNGRQTGLNFNSALNGYTPGLPPTEDAQKNLTFTLYSKGVMVFSKVLYTEPATGVFRLPAGFKSDAWSVKLNGQVRVKNVKIAETPDGLRKL